MFARKLTTRCAVAAALSSVGHTILAAAAQQTDSLLRPPGVRLVTLPSVTLPSEPSRPRETVVAVDPRDSRHLVVSFQQMAGEWNGGWGQRFNVHVAWSADGGETWAVATGTTHENYVFSADPSVTVDLHGHAFLSYVGFDHGRQAPYWGKGGSRNGVFIRRSQDGGRTFQAAPTPIIEYPTMPDPPFQDKPYVVADNNVSSPHAGNLYLGWTRFSLDKSEIMFSRSTDDGNTWSRPMAINTQPGVPRGATSGAVFGFHAVAGPDGTLYAIWSDGQGIVLAVSRDGGRTFEPSNRVIQTTLWELNVAGFLGANGLPAIAIDPRSGRHGRLLVTWGDFRYGDIDILASTSEDGGRTWAAPVRVNDDPKHNGRDQVLSWLAVDSTDGAAYVLFYDRRGDPKNELSTVTLARSTDGGRTFTNYAWTVTATDPTQASYGDYIGLGASGGRVYGAWTESVPTPQQSATAAASGPAVIRIGIADFRTPPRVRGAR